MSGNERVTVPKILSLKGSEKITVLTAYDATFARIIDESEIDIILVGDSLGNVIMGYDNTLPVTMDEILHHIRAVRNGTKRALVVADMPFGSYQPSIEAGIKNAIACIKAGADAVKIEGGSSFAPLISELVKSGIPVMGHIGLTPQWIKEFGGYRIQGKKEEEKNRLIEDAISLDKAGCFSIVLEGIPAELSGKITSSVKIPTIGIGAGKDCDGQVLVIYDMLGLYERVPRFVKRYANLRETIKKALEDYIKEVKEGIFPDEEHSY